ncbi:hypothetical protein EW146_g2015 [Bondarzewia mesenterica]|uniref:Ubiquitin-like protease family profile domain-containing protein n=1 Tax=Bondarzewia mesenterica TaxID=1095465 RepID=A0A4S4M2K2_9AGAM|nr:hypothetical protein EW146_g2015 [Bondarzewia mesenterica]
MNLESKERRQINTIHGLAPPHNLRDASATSSNLSPWRREPIPINTLSSQTARRQQQQRYRVHASEPVTNPWSRNRTGSNLHQRSGNPTSKMTVAQSYHETHPGHKRRRVSLPSQDSVTLPRSKYFSNPTSSNHTLEEGKGKMSTSVRTSGAASPTHRKATSAHSPHYIEISDNEDQGVVMSRERKASTPDPIDYLEPSLAPQPGPSNSHDHPFDQPARKSATKSQSRKVCGDGDSTKRLRDGMARGKKRGPSSIEEDDPIESFDDQRTFVRAQKEVPRFNSPTFVNVRGKISLFEAKANPVPPSTVPSIDLVARQKQQRPSIKNGMKGKGAGGPLFFQRIPEADRIATAPSHFIDSRSGPSRVHSIPLQDWSIGLCCSSIGEQVYKEPCLLVWDETTNDVRVQGPASDAEPLLQFSLQTGAVASLQTTLPKLLSHLNLSSQPNILSQLLIQIKPSKTLQISGTLSDALTVGSSQANGLLTLWFKPSDPRWNKEVFLSFTNRLQFLTEESSFLIPPAPKSVWEKVERDARSRPLPRARREEVSALGSSPNSVVETSDTHSHPPPKGETALGPRRSTRLSGLEDKVDKPAPPLPDADEVILVYPFSGPGAVNITNADLARLKPDEFLNDTLIEFGLKLWLNELRDEQPELADQFYIFSSFFYKKLSTKRPEDGFQSVRKWTSKVDLFQKKYLIVPINEHLHWYLAIICNPEYVLQPQPPQAIRKSARISGTAPGVASHAMIPETTASGASSSPITVMDLPPGDAQPLRPRSQSRETSIVPESIVEDSDRGDHGEEQDVEDMITRLPESACTSDEREHLQAAAIAPTLDPTVSRTSDSPTVSNTDIEQLDVSMSELSHNDSELGLLMYPPSSSKGEHLGHTPMDEELNVSTFAENLPTQDDLREGRQPADAGYRSTSAVPASRFYGTSAKAMGKRKATMHSGLLPGQAVEDGEDGGVDEAVGRGSGSGQKGEEHSEAVIYTFDSLLSKHRQATNRLSQYLRMEAADKKGIDRAATTELEGRVARTNNRRLTYQYWDKASAAGFRAELEVRIRSLSDEWKRERAKREENAAADDDKTTTATSTREDSDSDIMEVDVPEAAEVRASPKKGGRRRNRANRLR